MTDLTWEKAREKVRERNTSASCGAVRMQDRHGRETGEIRYIIGTQQPSDLSGLMDSEPAAWLDAYIRMTETSPSPERIAAVTELPPLDVTADDARNALGMEGIWDTFHELATDYQCRQRQFLAALTTVASQTAEMAALREDLESESQAKTDAYTTCQSLLLDVEALRSAKEKAEAIKDEAFQALGEMNDVATSRRLRLLAAEAENTRLRDALEKCVAALSDKRIGTCKYMEGSQIYSDFDAAIELGLATLAPREVLCEHRSGEGVECEICSPPSAALSAPGAKREG